MGHALEEANRVLISGGHIVDIRPYFPASERNRRRARHQIYGVSAKEEIPIGTLSRNLSRYRFTDRLLTNFIRQNPFTLTARETFRFRYYLRDLASFDRFRAVKWDSATQATADRRRLERIMRDHPEMMIRVDAPVQLNVMRKA